MHDEPYFHTDSGAVRFWVSLNGQSVGASVSRETLHYSFRPNAQGEDPMETFAAHATELNAAVERRVNSGSIEPVMLREHDLRTTGR